MRLNVPDPPSEFRVMDIAINHLLKHFPTSLLRNIYPYRKIEAIGETNAEYKAIESYTDTAWKVKIDGIEMLVLYEEMTNYDKSILEELHFRKTIFHKVHGLDPVGIIIVPEKVNLPDNSKTTFTMGHKDYPHTIDENYIVSLSHPQQENDLADLGKVLLHLLNEKVTVEEAVNLLIRIRDSGENKSLVKELLGIGYFLSARHFGKRPLEELYKRIKPMIATSEIYSEIIEEGYYKGEAPWKAKATGKAIITFFELRLGLYPPEDLRQKLLSLTDLAEAEKYYKVALQVDDLQTFRSRTGL